MNREDKHIYIQKPIVVLLGVDALKIRVGIVSKVD